MMNQTIKVIAVTAAGFALGYALYAALQTQGVLAAPSNGEESPSPNVVAGTGATADQIGDAVAGVLID
tara:strand:+ start:162 stop:365 length:204 start_codon:yes stop_codon:yes gene_type:complete